MIRTGSLTIETQQRIQIVNITPQVREFVRSSGIDNGLCSIYLKHTSAAVAIQEDERLLKEDFESYFRPIVEDNEESPRYRHNCRSERPECPAGEPLNAGSHLSSLLVGSGVSIPVKNGDLDLGTWQQVLLYEFDGGERRREVTMTVQGEQKRSEIEEYLSSLKPLIAERMKSTFPFPESEYPDMSEDIRRGFEEGKHLRGELCVLISDALGGDHERALSYASCIDAIHISTLIHDDLIDADLERRGKPSFWIKHGPRRAVIVGDRLFALVKKRLLELGHREASIYAETLDTITSGVAKEVNLSEFAVDLISAKVHKNLYPKIIRAKTASLFRAAANYGAMAGRAKPEHEERLTRYGSLVGEAFQICDDLTDLAMLVSAERPKLDKLGSLVLMGIHYGSISLKGLLPAILSGQGIPGMLLASDLQDKAMADVRAKIKEANGCLKGIRMKKPYSNYLRGYASFAVESILAEQNLSLRS